MLFEYIAYTVIDYATLDATLLKNLMKVFIFE